MDDRDRFSVLGVTLTDVTRDDAVAWLAAAARDHDRAHTVAIANANTLNLAVDDPAYADVLAGCDVVFHDGTGVRWAARAQGLVLRDNLNGTDLVPALLGSEAGRGLRYYLLGSTPDAVERAAATARVDYPDAELVGFRNGFIAPDELDDALAEVNATRPDVVLVAMGNPRQERFIVEHRDRLEAGVLIGVGALVDRWAGDLVRAPAWVRRIGFEWLDILRRQPHKAKRYLLGNPVFLWRTARARRSDRSRTAGLRDGDGHDGRGRA